VASYPVAVAFAVVLLGVACHRHNARNDTRLVTRDSLEGTVKLVGLSALPQAMLVIDDSESTSLEASTELQRLAGLRIRVRGTRSPRSFHVVDFRVVGAQGVAASDGMLTLQNADLFLVTGDGKRLVVRQPSAGLRALVGHRIWIAGPLDAVPIAYGVID
jgi:hypothetical protein